MSTLFNGLNGKVKTNSIVTGENTREQAKNNAVRGKSKGPIQTQGKNIDADTLNKSGGTGASYGKILGKMGLLVAAIALVVGTIVIASNQMNKAENEMKNAQKAAALYSQEVDNAKSNYENLKSTITIKKPSNNESDFNDDNWVWG